MFGHWASSSLVVTRRPAARFNSLHDASGHTRNLKHRTILNESIDAGFAWSPEELAILVALAVQRSSLTVAVFDGDSTDIYISEARLVLSAASLAEKFRLLGAVKAAPLNVDGEGIHIGSLVVVDHKVGRVEGHLDRHTWRALGRKACRKCSVGLVAGIHIFRRVVDGLGRVVGRHRGVGLQGW